MQCMQGMHSLRRAAKCIKIAREANLRFADMFHGHDERVPVDGLVWGVEVLDAVVREIS